MDWKYRATGTMAVSKITYAIHKGQITRPDTCELCGGKPAQIVCRNDRSGERFTKPGIVAHHWNGYDHPLDVWWICMKCNGRLIGKEYHCGEISKEEARLTVANFSEPKIPSKKQCNYILANGRRCRRFTGSVDEDYCIDHRFLYDWSI